MIQLVFRTASGNDGNVTGLKLLSAMFVAWMALMLTGSAQSLHPRAPVFGISDDSGFFNQDSGAFKRISDQLRKLEHEHGFKIYVVVEPVLIASTTAERASELRQAWVPEGDGIVVVFESDSRSLGIGRDLAASPSQQVTTVRVPSHETNAILTRALESTDSQLAPEAYLETFVTSLVVGFDDYFKRIATPPPAERSMKIGLLIVGTVALLGLAAIGLGSLVRHSGMAAIKVFRFPTVDRPERLGAPCGGSVTSRSFASPRAS